MLIGRRHVGEGLSHRTAALPQGVMKKIFEVV